MVAVPGATICEECVRRAVDIFDQMRTVDSSGSSQTESHPRTRVGKYGAAAGIAAHLLEVGKYSSPKDAWKAAVSEVFEGSTSSIEKGCPRDTFLSLCETHLKPTGEARYTRSVENRRYAENAVEALRINPSLVDQPLELWRVASQDQTKAHNAQMDVVCTLWQRG
jgi:hypothetical protein